MLAFGGEEDRSLRNAKLGTSNRKHALSVHGRGVRAGGVLLLSNVEVLNLPGVLSYEEESAPHISAHEGLEDFVRLFFVVDGYP